MRQNAEQADVNWLMYAWFTAHAWRFISLDAEIVHRFVVMAARSHGLMFQPS